MKKQNLFDFDFLNPDNWNEVVDEILNFKQSLSSKKKVPFIITPNVDQIVKFEEYPELKDFFKKSFLILADGQPIVWSSHLFKKPLKRRLAGSDLFPILWKEIKRRNKKVFLILPSDVISEKLKSEYENMLYDVPPFFFLNDKDTIDFLIKKYIDIIEINKPEFVFLGLGFPKQEIISMNIYKQLGRIKPFFLLLGASFEFYTGTKKRAPLIMQRYGLEWFYRFLKEPKRLFKRYFIKDIIFIKILYKEGLKRYKK
jgi:N-acetylglucosaminyldiphosphoundecaprenol N-acetyl-beta-D-mannosaminyltransferase